MKILLSLFYLLSLISSSPCFSENVSESITEDVTSIVPIPERISDFEARFALAKILSHYKETREAALNHFEALLNGNNLSSQVLDYPNIEQLAKNKKKIPEVPLTLVPVSSQISDFDARLALARIYSHENKTQAAALKLYKRLLQEKSNSLDVKLEMGRLYIAMNKFQEGLNFLYRALKEHPNNLKLLIATAQAEGSAGHARQARELFLQALCLSNHSLKILLDYADTMMMWGDFYQAEDIFRLALDNQPCSIDLYLKLAWSLASMQRYEEAEGIYRKLLLSWPQHAKILDALARLKIQEKDYDQAQQVAELLLQIDPTNPKYVLLVADILFMKYQYCEAITFYSLLKNDPEFNIDAYIGIGRALQKLNQCQEAQEAFAAAYASHPESIEAQFYLDYANVLDPAYIDEILCSSSTPKELDAWANVYVQNGMAEQALSIYEAILSIDSEYFPAQIGAAEMLGILYMHKESLERYQRLLEAFPHNVKLMVAIARVLGWSEQYDLALQAYDDILKINPNDPVLYREKARTAFWGNRFNSAIASYNQLLDFSVDQLLFEALQPLCKTCHADAFLEAMQRLNSAVLCGSIYAGFEEFSCWFYDSYEIFPLEDYAFIQQILTNYVPDYLIQKSIFLEKRAKTLVWNKFYRHSLRAYRTLLDFNPGNEEALFDYGQSYCIVGLCNRSRDVYANILHIDPNHNLVKKALRRNEIRTHFGLQGNLAYWREIGSGTFAQSQIARYRAEIVFEEPLSCRSHLRFIQQAYVENPFFNFKFYPAEGQTIEGDCIFNECLSGNVSVTYKNYFNRFKSTFSSHNRLVYNMYDYFQVVLGCNREDEIYNYFSLKQAIQSINSWLTVSKNINHNWSIEGTLQYYRYNDHNEQIHYNAMTEYQFSEDPNVFKIILQGNYRNAAHQSLLIFSGLNLVNVIHPYWTPDKYYSGSLTLEYRHDYRNLVFCESPQRYIDLKITGETDSEDNPSIQAVLEWKHDFEYHWGFELKGLIHRSKQWNAEGGWATLYYRF